MSTASDAPTSGTVRSLIPARIDRLPWSPFHTRLVAALGVAWVLDGLEITVASTVAEKLGKPDTLDLSVTEVGLFGTIYLLGEVAGALYFGRQSDRLGRRKLFVLTLAIYLFGSFLTALTLGSGTPWIIFLFLTRFIAGAGIGGEYAAINSAIDELIPSQYRGRIDILVNGTYWAGALIGALGNYIFFHVFEPHWAWRIGFLLGPVLGLVIIYVRRNLPESPRWQVMNGHEREAEESIAFIEEEVRTSGRELPPVDPSKEMELTPEEKIGYFALLRVLFKEFPARSIYGATLMITQSFLYNAIFFTQAVVLGLYFHVPTDNIPLYFLFFCAGNFLGPVLLGPLFDTVGRKQMIAGTYITSGVLLAVSAFLFWSGVLTEVTQMALWCVVFFIASAGASAAYLTVSEIFPLEVRAKAIAVFFAIAQCFGAAGPAIFTLLIGSKDHPSVDGLFIGYLIGAGAMIAGGLLTVAIGVAAEGKSLEDIAAPLAARNRPGTARAEGAAQPSL
jgi:MFS family permease